MRWFLHLALLMLGTISVVGCARVDVSKLATKDELNEVEQRGITNLTKAVIQQKGEHDALKGRVNALEINVGGRRWGSGEKPIESGPPVAPVQPALELSEGGGEEPPRKVFDIPRTASASSPVARESTRWAQRQVFIGKDKVVCYDIWDSTAHPAEDEFGGTDRPAKYRWTMKPMANKPGQYSPYLMAWVLTGKYIPGYGLKPVKGWVRVTYSNGTIFIPYVQGLTYQGRKQSYAAQIEATGFPPPLTEVEAQQVLDESVEASKKSTIIVPTPKPPLCLPPADPVLTVPSCYGEIPGQHGHQDGWYRRNRRGDTVSYPLRARSHGVYPGFITRAHPAGR